MAGQMFEISTDARASTRGHQRVPAVLPIHIFGDGVRVGDQTRDISEKGMCVETNHPLPVMSLVAVRVGTALSQVLGRVMWSSAGAMGIRFDITQPQLLDTVESARRLLQRI